MTVYASEIGPNNCTFVNIDGREIWVIAEGQTEVNVGDSGVYINQESDGQSVGLWELTSFDLEEVASVDGEDGEWFAGFDVDWANGETAQGSFSSDRLVVNASTAFPQPVTGSNITEDVFEDKSLTDRVLNVVDEPNINDRYCRGVSDSFEVKVDNASKCKAISASATVTNELTGESTSYKFNNSFSETDDLRRINSATIEHQFTIPDDTPLGEQQIFTVDIISSNAVNNLPTFELTSTIGSNVEDLSLQPIDDFSESCSGTKLTPDVVAENASNCEANLGIEIVNNINDEVVTVDASSVPTGEAEPGTNSYFINFNVPDVPLSVDEVNYEANLIMAEQIVDTETFTVEVSKPQLGIGVFEAPSQACGGDEIRMSIEGQNNGGCDGSGRAIVTNNINDEVIETSNTSLRADSSRSIRIEDTIPPNASEEGAIEYTASLVDSEGNKVAEETATVNIGSVDISLQNLEFPDSVCAGKTVSGEVEATNNGDCPTDVTVAIRQESTEETNRLSTVSLRDGSSRTVRFEQQIPFETIELDQDTFTLSSQVAGPDGNIVTDTIETTVDINSTDIQLVGISSPSSACVGSEVNASFNIANEGGCDGEYRVLVTDSVSQNEQVVDRSEIRSQRRDTAVLQDSMPVEAIQEGAIAYSYQLQSQVAGSFETVEEGEFTVSASTSELVFGSIEIPEQQCIGTSVDFKVPLENVGECDTEYRVVLNNVSEGETKIVGQGTINSGNATTTRFSDDVTSELATDDEIIYDIELQNRLNEDIEWQTVEDIQPTVNILKPNVTVTSNNYPEFTSPGEKQFEIEISNDSTCSTNVDVNISGETTNLDISPESSLTITDSFTVTADDEVRSISVIDNILESEVDSFEATIRPHKFINVNQSEGVLEIKGGFDEEAIYSGTLLATAVSEGENLEEKDSVLGAAGINSIQGTSTTDSTDKDTVKYGALKGVNIQISETSTIVVDGQIRGTGKTYRHSTATSSIVQFNGDEQPQIKTVSGPSSNLGAVRRRLGIGTQMLSGPIFTIDR